MKIMERIRMCCLLLLPVVLMYEQHQFTVKYERTELIQFDHSHIARLNIKTFKYNRTQACTNATLQFNTAFGNNLKIEVQAYKFASNEYREFPLRFMFDFCTMANKDEFGLGTLFKCGNVTGCPLKKVVYHICKWFPNGNRFPPYIPGGSYMLDLKIFYHSVEVIFFQFYGIISYPEV